MNNQKFFETASEVLKKYQLEDQISRNIKIPILGEIVKLTFLNENEVPTPLKISHPYWKSQVNTDLLVSTVSKVLNDLSIRMIFNSGGLTSDGYLFVTFTRE